MAVFTPVTEAQVASLLQSYDLGALRSLQPVPEGVENTNYRLETDAGVFALTLFEKRTPPEALPFCLNLSEHAARAGAPTPPLQRTRSREPLSRLADRPAAIVGWLPGRWSAEPSADAARAAGRALAELHRDTADFPLERENPWGPSAWRALLERCRKAGGGAEAAMLADLSEELADLEPAWPAGLPTGAIHADYFPDNVLFEAGAVSGIIDLYFACTDALAYDLAVALNAWGFDVAGSPAPARLSAMIEGYESERPLRPAEAHALPRLCRGAAVRFTLTRLHDRLHHDPSWAVTPKDPAAFHKRLAFHRAWEARSAATGLSPLETLASAAPRLWPPPGREQGS